MRIGPQRKPYEKQVSLHDWINNSGIGLFSIESEEDIPEEAIVFCENQFRRFGIELPPEEVIRKGAYATMWYIDAINPYCILSGTSDVIASPGWSSNTYELLNDKGKVVSEADPEFTETFSYVIDNDAKFFSEYIAKPGLESLPYMIGHDISEILFSGEVYRSDPISCDISQESNSWLDTNCKSREEFEAYFKLPAWAMFLWISGPHARQFRYDSHEIFFEAITHGEALLCDGYVISAQYYIKKERVPKSCSVCGLDSWCVDMVYIDGATRRLCEHHLNGAMPLYGDANCGTRVCRFVACPYHPMRGTKDALYNTLKERGQLNHVINQSRHLIGNKTPLAITNS